MVMPPQKCSGAGHRPPDSTGCASSSPSMMQTGGGLRRSPKSSALPTCRGSVSCRRREAEARISSKLGWLTLYVAGGHHGPTPVEFLANRFGRKSGRPDGRHRGSASWLASVLCGIMRIAVQIVGFSILLQGSSAAAARFPLGQVCFCSTSYSGGMETGGSGRWAMFWRVGALVDRLLGR